MNEKTAERLADEHWAYVGEIAGAHYRSAFIHGYKHGVEDAASASTTPKEFLGWTVIRQNGGQIAIVKTIDGQWRVASIGTEWDPKKALDMAIRVEGKLVEYPCK